MELAIIGLITAFIGLIKSIVDRNRGKTDRDKEKIVVHHAFHFYTLPENPSPPPTKVIRVIPSALTRFKRLMLSGIATFACLAAIESSNEPSPSAFLINVFVLVAGIASYQLMAMIFLLTKRIWS
jgi:hypothetical protein